MTLKKTILCLASLAIAFAAFAQAQNEEKFKARLAPAPAIGMQPAAVAGIGSASATLTGRKLTITGSFEKMASAATTAKIGSGQLTGVRGSAVFDLTVTKDGSGTSGTIAGTFDMTPILIDALKNGRLYIQIQSEKVPNGHLLGWILK
jgi:hypothetical protein